MTTCPRRNPVINCPLTATWAAVGGKWKLTIIYWLAEQPRHFAGLRRQLGDVQISVSQKVLAQQLRELMADGIVARTRTGAIPAPVIYALTDYGNTVLPLVENARVWGNRHIERTRASRPDGARESLDCMVTRSALHAPSSPVRGGDCPIRPARE